MYLFLYLVPVNIFTADNIEEGMNMFTIWFCCRQLKKLMIMISVWRENKKEREAEMTEWERQEAKAKKIKIIKVVMVIVSVGLVIDSIIVVLSLKNDYDKATDLIKEGEYIEAYEMLESLDGYRDSEDKKREIYAEYIDEQLDDVKAGDTIKFGFYEQDNDLDNGKEDIEWIVLKKRRNKVLVISKYGLDSQQYNDEDKDVTWASCTLRKWLNEDFLESAFDDDLQKQIAKTSVNNKFEYRRGMNDYIENGKNTKDKIFLLSQDEFEKDFLSMEFDESYYGKYNKMKCELTAYADGKDEYGGSGWWLRISCHGFAKYVRNIVDDARVSEYRIIRPALWINIKS